MLLKGAHDLLGEGLESAGEHDALLGVDRVLNKDQRGDVFEVEGLRDLDILDLVKKVQDIDIGAISNSTQ